VIFVGRRERDVLHLYYSAADVFVTTPWYEPACTAEPRPAARRLLDQPGILARPCEDGVTHARSGGFGRPVSFSAPFIARRSRR
ncbi:hypothetical protein SB751_33450, partial [Cupriavidus sp. SIMBA_020]|uniref:hypothetical protein n=1 Tax=Cupriavidus sp. SIMBA_020 TaxID=3085766 RepID=UPI00397A4F20